MKHEQDRFLPEEIFQSCLQQVYEGYMSREYIPTEEMEQSYQQLEAAIGAGDSWEQNAVISAANALCAVYEREAFAAGFQMGAGILLHLENLNNL